MSFYRTYRPQVIDEMDNAHVRDQLLGLMSKDRAELPHAYVFTGPKGTGKTTAARLVAKLFNCQKLKKSGPCGACDSCISISKGTDVDVLEIDAASNRGIDEMRTLRERIGLAPTGGAYKIYIIDEVHMLTTEAFNALLKTLEEPPKHAIFVLATTDPHKVPDTIMSRCMHVSFARATIEELTHVLARIAKAEHVAINEASLQLLATAADGSFRDGAKLLEQVSFAGKDVDEAVVRGALSLTDTLIRKTMMEHLAAQNAKALLEDIASLVASGRDLKSYMTDLLGDLEGALVSLMRGESQSGWSAPLLQKAIAGLLVAFSELKATPIPQLPLELFVIEFCRTEPDGSGEDMAVQKVPATKPLSVPSPMRVSVSPVVLATPVVNPVISQPKSLGMLTFERLLEHWPDVIAATKPFNHSIAGVLRSSRPKAVGDGIVTIEAFYKFHQEKLSEVATKQMLGDLLKKLFGEKVKVEVVLGKK